MDCKNIFYLFIAFTLSETEVMSVLEPSHCDCTEVQELRQMVLTINKTMERLSLPHVPVGFSVALTTTTHLGDLQTVKFDKVITNIGNAYEPRDGHFVAPVKGLYHFTVTATDATPEDFLYLQLVKNGVAEIGRVYTGIDASPDTGSISVVVHLEANDRVWVRSFPGRKNQAVDGGSWSSFSGFLLQTM